MVIYKHLYYGQTQIFLPFSFRSQSLKAQGQSQALAQSRAQISLVVCPFIYIYFSRNLNVTKEKDKNEPNSSAQLFPGWGVPCQMQREVVSYESPWLNYWIMTVFGSFKFPPPRHILPLVFTIFSLFQDSNFQFSYPVKLAFFYRVKKRL